MKEIETVVADNINRLLEEKNINKNDLAKIAGVSESTVGKWTLEKATPRMGAIQKISDYFNIPKSYILEESVTYDIGTSQYNYIPTAISAGVPLDVEAITNADKITLPDSIMGKYAGNKDVVILRVNGDSMNNIMPDDSLIAIKLITLDNLYNGDIVVYSHNGEYSVKHYNRYGDALVFKPNSTNTKHKEQEYSIDDGITIHGKVVMYIVNLD